ncbi:MAG: mechanosensitive ion channel family protein [Neomegalonema sp.]
MNRSWTPGGSKPPIWGMLVLWVFIAAAVIPGAAQAQFIPGTGGAAEPAPPTLPEELTPETVDSALARLTDSQIRELLRDELQRRASETAEEEGPSISFATVRTDFEVFARNLLERVARLLNAVGTLESRAERVAELRATAANGMLGMVGAFLVVIGAAAAAAYVIMRLTGPWRDWLLATDGASYWERLVRSIAFGALQVAPIIAFSTMVYAVAPVWRDELGPMVRDGFSYIWIFEAGVVNVWVALMLFRRVFAPTAPQLRLANATDAGARHMYKLVVAGAIIGMGGWLLAGLWPMLGYGFPPAILTMATAGTLVYLYFFLDVARGFSDMREAMGRLFGAQGPDGAEGGATRTIVQAAAPWVVIVYFTFGYLYWLAHWLATGQQQLAGPVGTLLVGLALPAFDRLGDELAWSILRDRESARAQRLHLVLRGAWRVILGLAATVAIASLWGFDLLALAKGDNAPGWLSAAFDIALTLLIGQLVWRLIQAALYQERLVDSGDMEEVDEEVGGPSRLQTLIPMFRILLLIVLTVVVLMIILSSLGVSIGPLLASAGIVGIAVGFGAQTLVRDIFSGMFFLIDDAFRVGEYIELDPETRGQVEAISIRSLQLRHHRGSVITIPFGEMKSVTNHNRDWVIYKMPFRLEPDTDPLKVKKIVKRIGFELLEDPEHGPKFLEPLKSQGVFQIDDDSALIMRVKFKCKPRMQFVLRREVYHRLQAAFDEAGIKFARKKVEVISSAPVAAGAAAALEAEKNQPGGLAGAGDSQ